ncbi:MAG: lspA [Proteobacteria bacterium]|nr:lspA [Pseudomonadota bacterium]
MSALKSNRLKGLLIAAAVLAADLAVKAMVMGPWQLRELHALHATSAWPSDRPDIPILPFFGLTWTQNFGVSLGMFTADSAEMRWGLVALTLTIAIVVFVWLLKEKKMGDIAALGLVLGGALGNIRDRTLYGYVIDYADLHFGNFRPFLIFNIADAAISIGVVIILARALFLREKRPEKSGGGESDNPETSGPEPVGTAETK